MEHLPSSAKAASKAQRDAHNHMQTMAEKKEPHRAVLIFSAPVVKDLVSDEVRLPPNYVGVRRIRPSSFTVKNEFRGKTAAARTTTEVVYKITDANGIERRMNSQEKKKLKLKLREERAQEKKRLKKEATDALAESTAQNEEAETAKKNDEVQAPTFHVPLHEGYHQLEVSKSALEEELADLRGDRDGVPPVMLSPPLANEAFHSGILAPSGSAGSSNNNNNNDYLAEAEQARVVLDDMLANRWAALLKLNMKSAEETRERDAMRPMPYRLMPEVWARLRPESLTIGATEPQQSSASENEKSSSAWLFVTVRNKRGQVDADTDAVVSILYRQSNLHVSCGAKFGCDFLLYDGRRDQRHAFAGLRIIERTSSKLPLPSPYDLTGYVRCLNTAGKLALLATVEHDESGAHVAIVDLALEKILQQGKRKRGRRDAAKNLEKHH